MPLTRIATLDLSKFTEFINSILSFIIDSNGSMTNASRLKLQPLMISQYFSDTTENLNAQIEEEISLILEILLRADKESYDTTKLETVLKQTDLTTAQRKVFVDIWGVSKEKVY